jgi:hypothetical protein
MKKSFLALTTGILLLSFLEAPAQEWERKDIALTVYNQNFALVRDSRNLSLKEGLNRVSFSDIASQIEPASVYFKTLTNSAGSTILEQNFEYDLVSADKLLLKYVDREIAVTTKDDNRYQGYLASYDAKQLVLVKEKTKGPIFMVNRENIRNIEFPQLPEGLITKPTLVWSLQNRTAEMQTVEVSYLTGGINWLADYVVNISGDEKSLALNGWISIDNRSGADYENARLKLIAGDVHRAAERPKLARDAVMLEAKASTGTEFEEKAFFEYHLYTLQRRTTLKNNQTKQISLLTAGDIPMNKIYTYDGALYRYYYYDGWQGQPFNKKVAVNMEFKNSEKSGLGIPLPKGKIKVYKADTDGSSQFIGEDLIDHTPKDETIALFLGNAFDIAGERRIMDHTKVARNTYRDTYEILLRNHKMEPVTVKIIERQWGAWTILQTSHTYVKKDANTLEFAVSVPKDGETKLTYTSEYRF